MDQLTLIIKKKILLLENRPTQGFEHTLTAEKLDNINFTVRGKKFCLSLHYNGANSYLFVNGVEQFKFKAKDSRIVANPLGKSQKTGCYKHEENKIKEI